MEDRLKQAMIQTCVDWYIDNPSDDKLREVFFRKQKEYKEFKTNTLRVNKCHVIEKKYIESSTQGCT